MTFGLLLGALDAGPVRFDRPVWLLLIPVLGLLTWWIARKSLAGLGHSTRVLALCFRVGVIALIAAALAEPQFVRVAEDVAVTVVVDASRSIPAQEQRAVDDYIARARDAGAKPADRLGVVTVGRDAYVQSLPSRNVLGVERAYLGDIDATNLAAGLRMAVAVTREDAANRLVLASDGNETEGNLLAAAEAARAAGVPIDVLPVEYAYPAEVILDRIVAPANARGGETINLSIVLQATAPVIGTLRVTANGDPIDLDPDEDGFGAVRALEAGQNFLSVQIEPRRPGPQTYEASFEPIAQLDENGQPLAAEVGDAIIQNNRASAVTFVGSEGWVLVVSESIEESSHLFNALVESGLRVDTTGSNQFPGTLVDLNAYDAIVLVNQPSYNFTAAQQAAMLQYVNDSGGGLVMTGGPNAFGAGGWIGSPLEPALPVKLDPPQKRQMPRGALAIVVHSVEMPQGVYWGKQVCNAAVEALSRLDYVGIVEFQGFGGTDWVYPMRPKGDGIEVKRAIEGLQFGDMPSFDPSLELALQGLEAVDAGQRHTIVISDGDPSLNRNILRDYKRARVTISTVGVFPHSPSDLSTMKRMAEVTGGEYYDVTTTAALAELPEIIVKEAQTVKRNLIWEGEPFPPAVIGVPTETMRGISSVPPISGYVVAADREGLSLVTMRALRNETRDGQEVKIEDPIAAQWQYGLGRVVAFTSDSTTRWAPAWVGWDGFRQFWEQHVRWAMRPVGSANVRVITETDGTTTDVIIEALDDRGERLNFADFQARAARAGGQGQDLRITQIGPGRYRGSFESEDPGAYVVSLRYRAPGKGDGAPPIEGSVQAAVTRPFADEFRATESNLTVLRRVAEVTGGRLLTRDPQTDDLWRREGLTMPESLRPIWLAIAIAGIGLFLVDVGVRRVRIEPRKVVASVAGLFGRASEKKRDEKKAESLMAARAKARARMSGEPEPEKRSSRKFEAGEDSTGSLGPIALSGEAEAGADPSLQKQRPTRKPSAEDDEGGMSRLMRAKRRAQDEMKDEDGEQS